jgi:hypothetical protein
MKTTYAYKKNTVKYKMLDVKNVTNGYVVYIIEQGVLFTGYQRHKTNIYLSETGSMVYTTPESFSSSIVTISTNFCI